MTQPGRSVAAGSATVACMILADVLQWSALPFALLVVLASFVAVIAGRSLPHWLRTAVTVLVVYWAFSTSLLGRTMEPGLSLHTASLALRYFVWLGLLPLLSTLRIWRCPIGPVVVSLAVPTALLASFIVAHTEEVVFVRIHRENGCGPTPRWTVPMHWLAYDAATETLRGSD